jgi:hypothetical protein
LADLTVVSERSTQEIKKQKATAKLKTALADLTANLIRVVRGHGKQDEILDQLKTLSSEIDNYTRDVGQSPRGALLAALIKIDWNLELEDDRRDEALLERRICLAALQIVASSLLKQRTHRERAMGELQSILRSYVETRNEKRR